MCIRDSIWTKRTVFVKKKTLRITHGTCQRYTRHTCPNVDDNIPQTCPCTWKAELWRAVQLQRDTYSEYIIHTYKVPLLGAPGGVAQELTETCYKAYPGLGNRSIFCPGSSVGKVAPSQKERPTSDWRLWIEYVWYFEEYTHSYLKCNCTGFKYYILV